MKILVTFSGGKDSLAALLWIRNNFTKKFEIVFCDTNWESPITYDYIKYVSEKLQMPVIILKSKKYDGFIDLALKKKRFPSTKARFCTEELKTKPMIDYILDKVQDDIMVIQGIRGAESTSRSKMQPQCNYFKYYTEPYQTNTMIVDNLSKLDKHTSSQIKKLLKASERLKLGKEDAKYHTYRKKEVIKYINSYVTDVWRPIFDWTAGQTIEYILDNGFKTNPLYKMGFKRVGCFPCIMSANTEIYQLAQRFPERITELAEYERKTKSSFWGPDSIPSKFCHGKFPLSNDVVKYITAKYAAGELFEEYTPTSCMSYYGLCE
jgi:3'-phosphoadenosine 5'-phosphosulfate sulfotransferase (PAPS reductase)/FAD synthetase